MKEKAIKAVPAFSQLRLIDMCTSLQGANGPIPGRSGEKFRAIFLNGFVSLGSSHVNIDYQPNL